MAVNPATGPILKPPPKPKGGRGPKKAGIRQEREFAAQHTEFKRVVGSGAFGVVDPMLKGDLKGQIGRKKFLLEMKAWTSVDARGEKTINVPLSVLDKVRKEAETESRYAGVIFHPKNTDRWIAIFDWKDFYELLNEQEQYIAKLEGLL